MKTKDVNVRTFHVEHIVLLILLGLAVSQAAPAPAWFLASRTPYVGQEATDELWATTSANMATVAQRGRSAEPAAVACPVGYTCTPNPAQPAPAPPVPPPAPKAEAPITAPPISSVPQFIPASPITYSPNILVSAGGGFASPNGKFGYYSISKAIGQNSYATMAQQYTIVKGKIQNCALAGLSKEMYEFGPLVLGITGLGGGCEGFSGDATAAANAQAYAHFHFGKSAWGAVLTVMKTTNPGYQVTLAPTWGK